MSYRLKSGKYQELKLKYPRFRVGELAKKVGIKSCFMSLILNRRRTCSKMTAYCIVKAIDSELEIDDLFDRER